MIDWVCQFFCSLYDLIGAFGFSFGFLIFRLWLRRAHVSLPERGVLLCLFLLVSLKEWAFSASVWFYFPLRYRSAA